MKSRLLLATTVLLAAVQLAQSFVAHHHHLHHHLHLHRLPNNVLSSPLLHMSTSEASSSSSSPAQPPSLLSFDAAVLNRHACKKFIRYDGTERSATTTTTNTPAEASQSDPRVVQQAIQALDLARQAPSAYNSQPYKFIVVDSKQQKEALSKYALGPNRNRVLDSDVTIVFLADRQVLRTLSNFRKYFAAPTTTTTTTTRQGGQNNKWYSRKMQIYLALFSSGYPLPRCISAVVSFFIRTAVSMVDLVTRFFYPMPTLSSAETWSSKQALMVAMTYMLACSARHLDTIPMEGINARGIRRVLKVPSRYAVPLIVSTGREYCPKETASNSSQAAAAATAAATPTLRQRYPMQEMIFNNVFGETLPMMIMDESSGLVTAPVTS
jgi:nitroreductase